MKKRNSAFDILKIFLSIFVVLYHQYLHQGSVFNENFSQFDSWIFSIFSVVIASPVPIFILISAYLATISSKQDLRGFFKFGIDTFLYWVICVILVIIFVSGLNVDISISRTLTFGGRDWWYLWSFLIIKSISPILVHGIKNVNKLVSLTGIIFLLFMRFAFIKSNNNELFNAGTIIGFLSVYLVGIWMTFFLKEQIKNKSVIKASIIVCFTFVVFSFIFKIMQFWIDFNISKLLGFDSPMTPFPVIFSIFVFILITNVYIEEKKFINLIAKTLLPVYLFHFIFEIIMNQFIWSKVFKNSNSLGLYELNFFIALITWLITEAFALLIMYPHGFVSKYLNISLWATIHFINQKYKKILVKS
ncbi:acyltransferase family protein [Mesoplasma coleopterae]|uniref:Acyltransferase 3 domain-containing protein n=1 Tax=Mesoplasma coleopterae TaxID=324078 RepID=A0A2K8P2B9_9MOLU|nr:acyltransferase family protein [Mesoplasma coleopterae]ATZ20904.1 hypothetical protein MCOLE_v1c03900 [Mesoplasma coleopterae]